MKKKVLITISLIVVFSTFFSFGVFADTTSVLSAKSITEVKDNVEVLVKMVELYPFADGVDITSQTGNNDANFSTLDVVVTLKIKNMTSKTQYITNLLVTPNFTAPTVVSNGDLVFNSNRILGIENFSNDLYLSIYDAGGYLYPVASADWSFTGYPAIPANTVISCVAVFKMPVYYLSSSSGNRGPYYSTLNSVTLSNWQVYETDFTPQGAHDDLLISLEATREYLASQYTGLPKVNSYLAHIDSVLYDLKTYLVGDNTVNNNVTNDSNSLKTQSDNVHSQEQAYFTQNSQAIQATGLGNFQFGTVEGNGIGAVSNDFTSIWNALNGWNSVYIFSLTLGLALTILRHAPNAISRRQRRRQE